MDPRVALLREFYRAMPMDRAKLETEEHGFGFLERLLAGGIELEYGELTLSGRLHKYKLARIPPAQMDEFLAGHVSRTCNVCLYFDARANETFCINLDNNHRVDNTAAIPEVEAAVRTLIRVYGELGCEPLVVASGRGYHIWGRADAPVDNQLLYRFMLRAAAAAAAELLSRGLDPQQAKFNFYPNPKINDVVSLRLFGSQHAKTGRFSSILTADGLLGEEASWAHFADYLQHRTVAAARLEAAAGNI